LPENFSSISQVPSSLALEQKKHFEAFLPRPGLNIFIEIIIENTCNSIGNSFSVSNLNSFLGVHEF
jgi:hypothetical protein